MAESTQKVEEVTKKVEETEITQKSEKKRKVLIAIDPSKPAEKAFEWYKENLMRETDEVVIFHCPEYHSELNLLTKFDEKSISKMTEKMKTEQNKIETLTSSYVQKLRGKVPAKAVVATGKKPGEVICKTVQDEGVSVVVMGTRGLGVIKKAFLGSVSDYVSHNVGCAIVIVRDED